MSDDKSLREGKKKKDDAIVVHHTGTVHAGEDEDLAIWIVRLWRGGESPSKLDVFQVNRVGGMDVLGNAVDWEPIAHGRTVDMEEAVELAHRFRGAAQRDVNTVVRNPKGQAYLIQAWGTKVSSAVYDRFPLLLYPKTLAQQAQQQAAAQGLLKADEEMTAQSMMLDVFKTVIDRDDKGLEREGKIAGDLLTLSLEREKHLSTKNLELVDKVIAMADKMSAMAMQMAERKVEERALDIEERDHAEDRADRKAKRERENITGDIIRRGSFEAINVLGKIIPGFFEELKLLSNGEEKKQLPGGTNGSPVDATVVTAPKPPEEMVLVNDFVALCRAAKIDEKLFGKDDDAGNPVEPGIFTREQVAIFSGVRCGKLPVEALDALPTDSGKPEAVTASQMAQAAIVLMPHPEALKKLGRFMELRSAARGRS